MCEKPDYSLEAYKIAIATRNFEIDLYWKRSLFFWGFIATAAVGYGSLMLKVPPVQPQPQLAVLVACFGIVCSLCWSMVNRGSKYWQEHWETMVTELESASKVGVLFRAEDRPQNKAFWLNSRKLSVSRVAIALSDFTLLVWLLVVVNHLLPYFSDHVALSSEAKTILTIVFTICYIAAVTIACQSGRWKPHPSLKNVEKYSISLKGINGEKFVGEVELKKSSL